MTSTLPRGTLGSIASLVAELAIKEFLIGATRNIVSYANAAGMLLHINGKFTMGKL
jgi:hypothetical protein